MSSRDEVIAEIQRVTGQAASGEQLKILQSTGGKCILASAGSGKTTVLTRSLAVDISTGAIDPRKLLCTTYSKAGATEMSIRTQQLLSSLGMHCKVDVRTMHSSYYKVLRDFGIVKKVVSPGQRSMFIREACKDARVRLEDDDLETVDSLLSYQVNNLMDDKTLFNSYVFTLENISLEQYAAIRLGYSKHKQDEGFIDFDDMQMYMYMLCVSQKNPDVLNYCHNMWEYFYVDEFQDISKIQFAILRALVTDPNKLVCVGDDDQCLPGASLVETSQGCIPIERVNVGDLVKCGSGWGETGHFKVEAINKKQFDGDLVVITTGRGYTLKGTRNHVGFARVTTESGYLYNYLLYRYGLGYRTGVIHSSRFFQVANQEGADKAWVLAASSDFAEAKHLEKVISVTYGIPTGKFEVNTETDSIKVEPPAMRVFNELSIDWRYPHYVAKVDGEQFRIEYTLMGNSNKTIKGMHSSHLEARSSNEWFGCVLSENMMVHTQVAADGGKYFEGHAIGVDETRLGRIMKTVLDEAQLAGKYLEPIREAKITTEKTKFMPLGSIFPGMLVPVCVDGIMVEDVVTDVHTEHYCGYVYDLEVPGVRNFIADGVAVHNCIYQWRGADPTIIQNICAYYDLNKFILSTNYRCAGEIVKRAAVGIENNVLRSEKGMVPFNEGGNIRIIDTKANLCAMSQKAIDYIEFLINNRGATPDDIAILSRNNAHLGILGNMLMKRRYFVEANEGTKISGQAAFRDIKNVILMAEGTTSAEVCKAVLWRCCSYLGAAGATTMSKFMRDTNCTIKQAIGYALCHCFNNLEISDGGLNVPVRVASKLDVSLRSVSTQGIESLKKMYTVLDMPDVNERIKAAIAIYEESIAYMYKTADRSRCLSGMVEYMSGLIEEMGVQKLKSFIHLTEQTEQNQLMAPPGIGRITLSTMHGAKGREWKYVILMADDNICFPSFEGINTMLSRGVSESDVSNSVDENRRLHYVAMTRAKQELAIFAPVDDLSVFTLEALGILDSKNSSYNSHIISMAKNNVLPEWVRKEIDAKIKSEQSWYYYNEPWKSEADSDSDKPENSEVEDKADSDTPPWAEQDDGPEVTVSKASTSKPIGTGLMGRMGKPLTDFKSLAQSDPMEDELGDLFDGE